MAKYNAYTGQDEPEDDGGIWYWFLVPMALMLFAVIADGARL